MTQPFRGQAASVYSSGLWPGLSIRFYGDHILYTLPSTLDCLSSAVYGGGHGPAERIVNWKVPLDYACGDPVKDFRDMFSHWNYPPEGTVGLQTAAKLTHASIREEEGDEFKLVCCTTTGTRNSARAGSHREVFSAHQPGTINTVLLVDARMTLSAMVNAVITATEAKAAALQDRGIADSVTGLAATGTTTDAVVLAVSQSSVYSAIHPYAGTATTIGGAIGRLVYDTVSESAATQHED